MAAPDMTGLLQAIDDYASKLADAAAAELIDLARADAPVSTPSMTNFHSGRLRDSLGVLASTDTTPSFVRTVGSELPYAGFTDTIDTAPHLIAAKNAPFLRFYWENGPGGAGIYHFRFVNHPGTRGQHWFTEKLPDRWAATLEANAGSV